MEDLGELLDVVQTQEDGTYSLSYGGAVLVAKQQQDYEYWRIVVTDPRYRVTQADSGSGGEVTEQGWIQFQGPAPDEYRDNNFEVEAVEVVEREFSGQVYQGSVGDKSEPWPMVHVGVFKANISCEEGVLVAVAETDGLGYFELAHITPVEEDAPYYNVIVLDDDIQVVGAESESGGYVTDQGWLQFEQPPAGPLVGNDLFGEPVLGQPIMSNVGDDAFVNAQAPTGNFGEATFLLTSFNSGPDVTRDRAFIRFDPERRNRPR